MKILQVHLERQPVTGLPVLFYFKDSVYNSRNIIEKKILRAEEIHAYDLIFHRLNSGNYQIVKNSFGPQGVIVTESQLEEFRCDYEFDVDIEKLLALHRG